MHEHPNALGIVENEDRSIDIAKEGLFKGIRKDQQIVAQTL